jgi:hypothetical protein
MKDSQTNLEKALRGLDEALRRYEHRREDTLSVAKRLLRLQRMLGKARSALLREQLEAILAKPTLNQKDKETVEELFGAMLGKRSHH